jgi:hypothetical protein
VRKCSFNLNLPADQTDDTGFVDFVNQIIGGAVLRHIPSEVSIFKIDHWFDHKWLAFSGKALGAVGVWNKKLTFPPFVANRIVHQSQYQRDASSGGYRLAASGANIHHRGQAAKNLHRFVERIAPNSALFWYSGDTLATGRGSLMGYIPTEDGIWPWFLAFVRQDGWRIAQRKSIHEYEVRLFQAAAGKLQDASTPEVG